ncbi:FAD:protein FMN transferase [Tenacibaculum maritimum]|uniref:FAD:protein FMN transferase n=1 Tax=Tenacibaculum maritimum TaxID=107401 RepID=UPI0038908283
MRRIIPLLIGITFSLNAQQVFQKKALLMGVDFEFTVVANTKETAAFYIEEAIKETVRIENLISSWKSESQTSDINNNAGIKPVKVTRELLQLIKRSKRISELTNGFFDISYASLDKLWYFDKPMPKLPDIIDIERSIAKINYKNILINEEESTVFLKEKEMKIGFGSIGKGYVAEKVGNYLRKMGVKAGLINAGGDLTTWGKHPLRNKWRVQIADPNGKLVNAGIFDLYNSSVVTSGNYAKFIEFDNKRYSHIINPKTGWPAKGVKSVTVFCKNTELADALATAVFIMGQKKGLMLINELKGIECLLIDENNKLYRSTNLKLN